MVGTPAVGLALALPGGATAPYFSSLMADLLAVGRVVTFRAGFSSIVGSACRCVLGDAVDTVPSEGVPVTPVLTLVTSAHFTGAERSPLARSFCLLAVKVQRSTS